MFKFLLFFFIDIITPVISSTQIACDVMCAQHEFSSFYIVSTEKKIFFFKDFFLWAMAFALKVRALFHI